MSPGDWISELHAAGKYAIRLRYEFNQELLAWYWPACREVDIVDLSDYNVSPSEWHSVDMSYPYTFIGTQTVLNSVSY